MIYKGEFSTLVRFKFMAQNYAWDKIRNMTCLKIKYDIHQELHKQKPLVPGFLRCKNTLLS